LHWVQTILLHWHRPQFHIHCCFSSLQISINMSTWCLSIKLVILLCHKCWRDISADVETPNTWPFSFIQQLFLMLNDQLNLLKFLWCVLRLWTEEQPPIWRVAVNKLNKQSWTADKWWSSSLGVGRVANNSSP